MAHFAEIDSRARVKRVLVVPDHQEHRGDTFLRDDLGLGGTWLQTSFNGTLRRRFAAAGMIYDADRDAFILPRPYPSWTLDSQGDWQPPIQQPDSDGWTWDEHGRKWINDSGISDQSP